MSKRHPALEALRNRVIRAAVEQNSGGLLTEEATREAREAAAAIDAQHDIKAAWVLGMYHWFRYLSLPDGADLEDYTAAVRLLAPVHEADPEVIPSPLRELYEQIRSHDCMPPPDPVELNSRARNLISRYQDTGELGLLTEAVSLYRTALAAATEGGDSRLAWRKSNLGAALRMLFAAVGEPEFLTEAISLQRDALAAAPEDERAACQSNLAAALLDEHQLTGDTDLLTKAIALLEAAANGIAEDDAERSAILSNLAAAQARHATTVATSETIIDRRNKEGH